MKRFMVGMLTVMVLMSVITPFAFAGVTTTNIDWELSQGDYQTEFDNIVDYVENTLGWTEYYITSLDTVTSSETYFDYTAFKIDGANEFDGDYFEIDGVMANSAEQGFKFLKDGHDGSYILTSANNEYVGMIVNSTWQYDLCKLKTTGPIKNTSGAALYPTDFDTDHSDDTTIMALPGDNIEYPAEDVHPSTYDYMNVWIADSATWVDNEIANSETSGYKTIWDFKVPLYDSRNDMYYYQHFFVASNGDKYTQPFTVVMNETYGYISIIAMTDFKMQTLAERYSSDLIVAKDTVMNIDIADSHSGIAYTSDEDTHATYGYQKFSLSDVMYDDGGSVLDQFETAELYFLNADMQSFDDADLNDTNTTSGQMVLNVMMHYTAYDTDLILAYIDPDDMYPAIQMTYTGNVTEVSSQKVDEWSREVDGVTNYYFTKRVTLQFTSGDAFVGARLSYIRDDGTYTDLEDSATFSYSGNGSGGYYVTTPDVDDHIDDVMSLGDILLKPFQTFYNIASSMVQYIAMPLFNMIPNFIPYEVRALMLLSITFGLLAFITGRG